MRHKRTNVTHHCPSLQRSRTLQTISSGSRILRIFPIHLRNQTFHINPTSMDSRMQEDILIVGAGPAGASLAAFLGQNGNDQVQLVRYE